jgi:hypothetical protein
MFDLKRPCVNCPFRRGQGEAFRLDPGRLEEIRTGSAFLCHKTLAWTDEGSSAPGERPQQCAGLMAVLRREGEDNQIMQVAERLRAARFDDLDPRGEAYASWAEVLEAHEDKTG